MRVAMCVGKSTCRWCRVALILTPVLARGFGVSGGAAARICLPSAASVLPWAATCGDVCLEDDGGACLGPRAPLVGPALQEQQPYVVRAPNGRSYLTSIQIANGGSQRMWIFRSAAREEASPPRLADGLSSLWRGILRRSQGDASFWSPDAWHDAGGFSVAPQSSVTLPFLGTSVRLAPALQCAPGLRGAALWRSCRVGAPGQPQTLLEWTWTAAEPDVLDVSAVDGYSLSLRLEYASAAGTIKRVDAHFVREGCPHVASRSTPDSQPYVGCPSPCATTRADVDCCSGRYAAPAACRPGGVPVSPRVRNYTCAVAAMVRGDSGARGAAYAYAYDDSAGSITDHAKRNSRIKATFCDGDFPVPAPGSLLSPRSAAA